MTTPRLHHHHHGRWHTTTTGTPTPTVCSRTSTRRAATMKLWSVAGLAVSMSLAALIVATTTSPAFVAAANPVEIAGFTLVNAETSEAIAPLRTDSVIDLLRTGSELTVTVDILMSSSSTTTTNVMVQIELDKNPLFIRQEYVAPYSLGGDQKGLAFAAVPALTVPGRHTVTATALDSRSGVALGRSKTIAFTVVGTDDDDENTNNPEIPVLQHSPTGAINGERRVWHTLTLGLDGPATSEDAEPNPFTFYRLDVSFTHSSTGKTFVVPGYYAADGHAAHTYAKSGNVWLVHFIPSDRGSWTWVARFRRGENVAQQGGGLSAGYFDGATGSFSVEATNKSGRDLRAKGMLHYVTGKHHLRFDGTGEWFLKVGADSPENVLAYEDFSNTPNNGGRRKSWSPHKQDFNSGDPTWADGKGTGIIGAVNYLADQGMLAFSFLTMNINGDDKNVFPFVAPSEFLRYDVSKLAQWEIVFEHATRKGMFLHFKTQETENDQLLDGGQLGLERKLYYRELVARFGHHLALNWNLGEENTNSATQQKSFADWMRALDPYNHPIIIHTYPNEQLKVFGPLYGHPNFDGASIQANANFVFQDTLSRIIGSEKAGRPWVVANDEQGNADIGVLPDRVDEDHDEIRHKVLWGNIMVIPTAKLPTLILSTISLVFSFINRLEVLVLSTILDMLTRNRT